MRESIKGLIISLELIYPLTHPIFRFACMHLWQEKKGNSSSISTESLMTKW